MLSLTTIEAKMDRIGQSQVEVITIANTARGMLLKDAKVIEATRQYIFSDGENPLLNITQEQDRRTQELSTSADYYLDMADTVKNQRG